MKLNTLFKIGLVLVTIFQLSCRKDFDTITSNGNLTFSNDTLFLDTVFNNLSSTTHLFTVYNTSKNDVNIPKIKLARENSKYRINVDGISGTEFNDVLLLKNDSLFIFVEVTFDENQSDNEIIYKDSILFDPDGIQKHVSLITLIKDAHFLFDSNESNYEISETRFSNTKPYIIYGNAIVPKNKSLTIDPGTIVHFSENASLTISEGATLNINGTLNDSVVFKNDNLNYQFNQVPGQWKGININNANSVNINYLKIKNPVIALNIKENTNLISIKNTEIYNASDHAIYTQNVNIKGENIVVGQVGKSSLYLHGGDYDFKHCTFANYWNKGIRIESTISLANYYIDIEETEILAPLKSANFTNCIIAGTRSNELFLDPSENEPLFNFNFKNCLLDIENSEELYNTDNTTLYTNTLLNKELDFRNTSINDLRIGLENEGINQADISTALLSPLDIIGVSRSSAPDIGAYQHIDFNTLEPEENEDE